MNVKDLSTMIYDKLPEVDILKYEDTWLNSSFYYQTALKSYWFFKHKIDADKILKSPAYTDKMKDLIRIIESCRNLEQVTLADRHDDCSFAKLRSLIKVICDQPLIKRLYLKSMPCCKENLQDLVRCNMLQVLSIKVIVEEKVLEDLFEKCRKLYSLHLIIWSKIKCRIRGTFLMKLPNNMLELKLETLESIEVIEVENLRKSLERNRNLEVLYLDELRNGADFMNDLEQLVPFLKDLTLGSSVRVDNFGRFIYLKRLCLLDVSQVNNNEWIKIIAENCCNLEDLSLFRIRRSMEGISSIMYMKKLTKLCLDGVYGYSLSIRKDAMHFLTSCEKLQYLVIRNLRLNNRIASETIMKCPDLTYFEIEGCLVTANLILRTVAILERQFNQPNGRKSALRMTLSPEDCMVDHVQLEEIIERVKQYPMLELNLLTHS